MNVFIRSALISVGMLALSITSNVYSYSSIAKGLGTKADPIQITTCQQLQDISKNLSADYVLADDIHCGETHSWNNGAGFVPIGTEAAPFTGSLNGLGHSIFDLYIKSAEVSVGMIGVLNGSISNVGLVNVESDLSNCSYSRGGAHGTLVGAMEGSVNHVFATGVITGIDHCTTVGGLVGGGRWPEPSPMTIDSSYASVSITGNANDPNGMLSVGGLVGSTSLDSIVSNSFATGDVMGNRAVGGLFGTENAQVKNCFATGNVIGISWVGGFSGSASGSAPSIINSYSTGHVIAQTNVGGFLGFSVAGYALSNDYYDTDTSGQRDTGKGAPVHTAQMYQQANFSGWDFANTWTIDEGKAYPELKWEQGDGYTELYNLKTALRTYDSQSEKYFSTYGYFDGNTYALGTGNDVRVIQSPNIWGKDLSQVHYFNWDGKNVDFGGLPDCTNSADVCTPTNTPCTHLNAFYNGITGQATKRCLGPADSMVDDIYNAMIQAHTSIDITTLEPFPDGRFLAAMRNAITWLAVNDRKVTIRVLGGVDYGLGSDEDKLSHEQLHAKYSVNDENFLKALIRDIPADKAADITLYVGSMRSCGSAIPSSCDSKESSGVYLYSWNHSKIIDVDGTISIVGGHNWWTNSYLTRNPISDLSVEVQGPASRNAEPFVDSLWGFICKGGNDALNTIATSQSWINGALDQQCLGHLILPATTPSFGTTAILGVGRLGLGMYKNAPADEPADQSELARNQMLSEAKSTIRIAQQNLQGLVPKVFLFSSYDRANAAGDLYNILAKFLMNKGNVYVVTTNYKAKDASGGAYYTKTNLGNFADTIKNRVKSLYPTMPDADINTLLCSTMHLATIQPSTTKTWPDGSVFGNHSKVLITDDEDYYVGSHNIYAANLQEYGYIIGGKTATDDFITQYWNPLWQYSSAAAITGSEVPTAQCYFDTKHLNTLQCTGRTVISDDKVQYTGCTDSNDDAPITFATSTSTPIDPDETECEAYQSGTNQDNWTGCGQAELGSQDYTITW